MGHPLSRRRLLVALTAGAGAVGVGSLVSACTGSPLPVTPTSAPPTAPDPLVAVLDERVRLVEEYDEAARLHPELAPRLLPLRTQTEEQVVALRLALALPSPTPTPTPASTTTATGASPATSSATSAETVVPVDPAVTLEALRVAVLASGSAAAAVCEATTAERAPLVGSLAAAASCHELLLA